MIAHPTLRRFVFTVVVLVGGVGLRAQDAAAAKDDPVVALPA